MRGKERMRDDSPAESACGRKGTSCCTRPAADPPRGCCRAPTRDGVPPPANKAGAGAAGAAADATSDPEGPRCCCAGRSLAVGAAEDHQLHRDTEYHWQEYRDPGRASERRSGRCAPPGIARQADRLIFCVTVKLRASGAAVDAPRLVSPRPWVRARPFPTTRAAAASWCPPLTQRSEAKTLLVQPQGRGR